MNWLNKTPTELFNSIPQEVLEILVVEKQQSKSGLFLSKIEVVNQLMTRHILNKHHLPNFVENEEQLIRWIFCIYVIE